MTMRVLFYLPVVTPWWYAHILLPLIKKMAVIAEVHVLAPAFWQNTGLGEAQLVASVDQDNVFWHIVDDPSHPTLRTYPDHPDELIAFVRSIDPHYTICRSADFESPSHFPGEVRFLMETGAPPMPGIQSMLILQKNLLCHGEMQPLTLSDRQVIDARFADAWARCRHRFAHQAPFDQPRDQVLANFGLDPNRRVIVLPLEYRHEENFVSMHERRRDAVALLNDVASRLGDDMTLAVTDHPLNYRFMDNTLVHQAIASLAPNVMLVPNPDGDPHTTDLLVKNSDGIIVQTSKTVYSAAFFDKPILRMTACKTAPWLNTYSDMDDFFDHLRSGTAICSDEADLRTWYGLHVMHDIVELDVSAEEVIDRIDRPFAVERLAVGIERFEGFLREHFLPPVADPLRLAS
jgi:hypothetical protein